MDESCAGSAKCFCLLEQEQLGFILTDCSKRYVVVRAN